MALAKIRSSNRPGLGLAVCILNASDQFWNTTLNAGAGGFEAYNAANIAAYGLPLTEIGSTGVYSGAVPAGISIADIYSLPVYIKAAGAGGSLAASDLVSGPIGIADLDWSGTAVSSMQAVKIAGYLSGQDPATLVGNLTIDGADTMLSVMKRQNSVISKQYTSTWNDIDRTLTTVFYAADGATILFTATVLFDTNNRPIGRTIS